MAHHLRPSVRRRARSESGSIIILTALSMVLMLGIMAFAIDGSFLYTERNRMAAAADAAAKSAAIELKRRPLATQAELDAFAQHEVIAQGFAASDVVVRHPPDVTSAFSGNNSMVQAKVSRATNTFFASVVNAAWSSVSPLASAVAGASAPSNCLIANGNANMQNNTTLNGCNMAVGGTLTAGQCPTGTPTPQVTAGAFGGGCANVTSGQPKPSDPLAGLAPPTVTGVGCPGGVAGTASPLPGGCYTTIASSVSQLATGGTFQVSGKISTSGSFTGTNVLLYLTSTGSLEPSNNDVITLTAQTTGAYQGIVIYGDNGSKLDGKNSFDLNIGGAVYMPGGDFDFKNRVNVTPIGNCLLLIVNNYTTKNTGSFTSTNSGCYSTYGGAAFLGVALAE